MGNEKFSSEDGSKKVEQSFGQFALSQPDLVQKALKTALSIAKNEAIAAGNKSKFDEELDERIKLLLVNCFYKNYELLKKDGLIPFGFDADAFDKSFKTWAAFLTKKDLIETSINLSRAKPNDYREAWRPSKELDEAYLLSTARMLFEEGDVALRNFLYGNKTTNLFSEREIEIINTEVNRLKSK